MKEIRKEIDEYPDIKISNKSKIYSKYSKRLQKITMNNTGYYVVNVKSVLRGRNCHLLHRIIAQAFIPNPKKYKCINHIDGNKKNNEIANLEWITKADNNRHAYKTGLANTEKAIVSKNIKTGEIKIYKSAREIDRRLNIDYIQISDTCYNKQKTCHGYEFDFKKDVTTSS